MISAQRKYQLDHQAQGLCIFCSDQALAHLSTCERHRQSKNLSARDHRRRKLERANRGQRTLFDADAGERKSPCETKNANDVDASGKSASANSGTPYARRSRRRRPPPTRASKDDVASPLAGEDFVAHLRSLGPDDPLPIGVANACRRCGCTDERGCPEGCWWIEEDLCSSCGVVTNAR